MSEFVRYTPENPPSERDIKIGKIKDLVGKIISNKSQDQVALTEKASLSSQVFGTLGYDETRVDNVETLINTSRDPNKDNKRAMDSLDILSTGIYEAMLDTKDEETEFILGVGSVSGIESQLPEDFKGIGRKVVDKVTENTEMTDLLIKLDNLRQRNKGKGRLGNDQISKKLEETYSVIDGMDIDEGNENGRDLVMTYLSIEAQILDGEYGVSVKKGARESVENSEGMEEFREAQRRYFEIAERDGRLKELVENISLEEILDAYMLIKAPRERSPQLWEYSVPGFMNGMSLEKWRKLLSFEDAWLGAIYNKRASSEYNNSLEKMKDGILNMKSLAESDIKMWYEDNTLNLRGVMHQISRDLLTEKTIKQDGQTCRIYAFDTKKNPRTGKEEYIPGSRVEEFVNNEDIYKQGLAKRLVEMNVIDNEKVAKLSVALAMDIMEMGGVFSVADSLRGLSWESDAVRLAQRPERKYSLKVGGGELFAGPWTELANTLSQGDLRVALELVKSWGVVPELLSGSFLDQRILLTGGKKSEKTMMEMIYRDERIPFRELENDLFFSWRKDHVMPAARMWMYITNKTPLEFSRNREGDTVISQWRADLYNDINQLRKNSDSVLTTPIIAGAVGGSIGLYPFEGPYLRIGTQGVHGSGVINYSESVIEIITGLGMNKDESNQLLRFFGVDRRNYKDLSDKFVAYTAIRNLTLPEFYRRKSQRVLSRKRPFN